jgi:Lon protease-like protein
MPINADRSPACGVFRRVHGASSDGYARAVPALDPLEPSNPPDALEALPIFPLANVVLFPHGRVPLHVFEPRYREMTEAALAADRRIGMTTVRPEHVHAMAGDPPVFSVGCAGVIERAVRRDDGRYDIVLLGTHRFRIVEELPRAASRLHRVVRAAPLADRFDPAREGEALQVLRADAIELLGQMLRHLAPGVAHRIDPRRFSGIDDVTFVNLLCQMLEIPPAEKQGLLEADGIAERCERLLVALQFRLAELGGGLPGGPRTLH